MCGIFGIIKGEGASLAERDVVGLLQTLFILSETRGKESSGLAVKNGLTGDIHVLKSPQAASRFIRSKEYGRFVREAIQNAQSGAPLGIVAHARLVTNGDQSENRNNQPVIKDGGVAVHNGIIVNADHLWANISEISKESEIDTEVLVAMVRNAMRQGQSLDKATSAAYQKIQGAASTAMISGDDTRVALATNTGSLYYFESPEQSLIVFSSEQYILQELLKKRSFSKTGTEPSIEWIAPRSAMLVDIHSLATLNFSLCETRTDPGSNGKVHLKGRILDRSDYPPRKQRPTLSGGQLAAMENMLEFNVREIEELRRCQRCILPDTFPFIEFDSQGICNYCRNYHPIQVQGAQAFESAIADHRKPGRSVDCLVPFSGGRDSSYVLHYLKKEMGLKPIAYTYDWGMVTDLGRRNQARMCGALGIEHIIVSADIARKRKNIRLNVSAWLKKPDLGTIPLFMAGDKQYFYYANHLSKINDLEMIILGENRLETTNFKTGFCGIEPNFGTEHIYSLGLLQKIRMLFYYGFQYMRNPSYLNRSLVDTLHAFASYYVIPHPYINFFNYIAWDENRVEKTLVENYDWEVAEDTGTTWRIGDGTAGFYNYIYYNVAGFSEIDTFRSNQVREGMLSREKALEMAEEENRPRFQSIKWYLDTIGLDYENAIRAVNRMPRLYRNRAAKAAALAR